MVAQAQTQPRGRPLPRPLFEALVSNIGALLSATLLLILTIYKRVKQVRFLKPTETRVHDK